MNREEYRAYLKSQRWREFRAAIIAERSRCEQCGLSVKCCLFFYGHGLDLHHLTYQRLGNELLEDLQVLCRACHELAEDAKRDSNSDYWLNHIPRFKGYPGLVEFPCPACGESTGVILFYGPQTFPIPRFWARCECTAPEGAYDEDRWNEIAEENATSYIEKHYDAVMDWRRTRGDKR